MTKKRWGTFSVRDHKNARRLAADVLLYDRLVFPAPPAGEPEARARWADSDWAPDLLDERLAKLKGLTETFDWGSKRHRQFKSKMLKLSASFDLSNMAQEERGELPYQMTRIIVAEEMKKLFRHDKNAVAIAAYQTKQAFDQDFILSKSTRREERLGYCIGCTIRVPQRRDPEATLDTAIGIARSGRFQRKRRALNAWQDEILAKRQPVKDDLVAYMDLVSDYNAEVTGAVKETRKRFACLVGTVAIDVASGFFGNPLAGAGGFLAFADFTTTDHKPTVTSGPTAMFHHIDREFETGWRRYAAKMGIYV